MKKSLITLIALAGVTYAGPYSQFPEITEGTIVNDNNASNPPGGNVSADFLKREEESGKITYKAYKHSNGTSSPDIRDAKVEVADGIDFYTSSVKNVYGTGELHITNTIINADRVFLQGSTELRNYDNKSNGRYSEIHANDISISENATIQLSYSNTYSTGQVKLYAENEINISTAGWIWRADFEASKININGSQEIYYSNFSARDSITITDAVVNNNAGYIMSAPVIEIQSGTLSNAGTIEGKLLVTGGTMNNVGTIEGDLMVSGGTLASSGTIEGGVLVTGGTYRMVNGAVTGALTATSGVINLSGNVTFTGDLNLGTDVSTFASDSSLTVNITQGATLTLEDVATMNLAEGVVFNVKLTGDDFLDVGESLFTIDFGNLDSKTIDEQLSKVVTTLSYNGEIVESHNQGFLTVSTNGAVTAVVPEPTTATLSLLALAGLFARRRRK